jgi:hypothetical protein
MSSKIPRSFQGILWSRNIHQILAYGGWEHLVWLTNNYDLDQIKNIFIKHPAKDYSERSFNFVQKVLLKIPDLVVDKRYYVKTYPRIIR